MHTSRYFSALPATNCENLHDADPQILRHKPRCSVPNSIRSHALRMCAVAELLCVIASHARLLSRGHLCLHRSTTRTRCKDSNYGFHFGSLGGREPWRVALCAGT